MNGPSPSSAANESTASPFAETRRSFAAWLVTGLLLVVLALLALRGRDWPTWVGDEANYLMAAQSLLHDFDFRYQRQDFERFVAAFGRTPEGLILQSPDGGDTLLFAKPVFYPAFVAPFLAVLGLRGVFLGQVLLLALTVWLTARALRPLLGAWAPAWIALFVFGSVMFAHVFWIHADLFLACLAGCGLALALDRTIGPEGQRVTVASQLGVVLLVIVVLTRPLYLPLLLPPTLLAIGRSRSLLRLFAPALVLALLSVGANQALRGSWTSYGGERQGFYDYTGYPEIDGADWRERIAERGPNSWTGPHLLPFPFDLRQTVWNGVYASIGRHVGVLVYFPPLLLCLFLLRPGEVRVTLLLVVALTVLAFLVVRPYNFWGGGGALANRYFLPLYPACWFLIGRPPRAWAAAALLLVAAPFLTPLWRDPATYLRSPDGSYAWVSPAAERFLPYETTQNHLKPSGGEDFVHGGLWVKPLGPEILAADGGERMRWRPDRRGQLLLGSRTPIAELELCGEGEVELRPAGAEVVAERDDGGWRCLRLDPGRPRARHPMWWSETEPWLYRLDLRPLPPAVRPDSPVRVIVRPVEAGAESPIDPG